MSKDYEETISEAAIHSEELLRKFGNDFMEQIGDTNAEVPKSRISILEELISRLREANDSNILELTGKLIENLDERAIIESKKESTNKRG